MDKNENILPPGFRFHPTDEELITYYLLNKVLDSNFNSRAISEVDLNKSEPWELPEKAKMGEKEWYFYSLRDRKYPTGLRTNRATEAGYWKATGKDREIYNFKTSSLVGMKKTLVFYRGRAPKGEKSNWVMHEYRLEGKFSYHYLSRTSKDEWVIARVFQKTGNGTGTGIGTGSSLSTTTATTTTREKKTQSNGSIMSFYNYPNNEVCSSPSSISISASHHLPPLLDSSYNGVNEANSTEKKHVSCFSINSTNFNPFDLTFPQPPLSTQHPQRSIMGLGLGPGLLQDNLNIPWINVAPPIQTGYNNNGCELNAMIGNPNITTTWGGDNGGGGCFNHNHHGIGGSELDCMWS
ncbi:unnamed protein product [Amaranthus hypochondriacus]